MNKNGILSDSEYDDVKVAAEFMILLRNEILHVNKNTKYDHIAYINKEMEHRVFESASDFFKSYNINTPEELHKVYQKHRKIIFNIKLNLFKILLDEEEKRKGSIWRRTFNLAEKGELNTPSGDPIIDIAMIWGLNRLGDKNRFNNITKQLNWNWGTCSSIACSNLASPELLENIRSYCQSFPELGYVLRLISENPNTNKETLSKIAEDPNFGFWSEVAKKRLESRLMQRKFQ